MANNPEPTRTSDGLPVSPTQSAELGHQTPTHSAERPRTETAGDDYSSILEHKPIPISAGRYQLGEEIARGGMGVVYRAIDTAFGREVAIKVLQEKYSPKSGAARRFAEEARITGQLQHPAIPPVHDIGTLPDGRPFLAMKLIKGQTLDDLLKARTDLHADRGRFVAAFEAVCQAVAYAHAHKVIHRDLKPANVMVGAFGEVQVMDWGLAKVLGTRTPDTTDPVETAGATEIQSVRDSDADFKQAGSVLGTPAFMPPEQAIGAIDQVDERSDVFGLGAILCMILTGKPPYSGTDSETIRRMAAWGMVSDTFAKLEGCGAESELVAICKQCLSPEKDARPANANQLAKVLITLHALGEERMRETALESARYDSMQEWDSMRRNRRSLSILRMHGDRKRSASASNKALLLMLIVGVFIGYGFAFCTRLAIK